MQTSSIEIPFDHRPSAHCENGVTRNLLHFYGYDYSEPLLFGLSASLYFVHLPFIRLAGFPVTSFRPLPGMIFSRTTRLLGFGTRQHIYFSPSRAERKLDSLLAEGTPTGVVVSMYFLPYMPAEYRFHFNAHNIAVFGKDGDDYLVSDPIAMEKVRLSARDMSRARFARGTYPPMGKLYYIRSLPRRTPDLPPLVRRAILTNCNRMIHQPGPVPWVGINTFDYLGKQIPRFPQQYGPKRAALHLAQLIRMMEEIGTGGAGFRFLYAAFLQEAADVTGIPALNELSARLTDIGDQWRRFAANAGRVCKNRSSADVDYSTLGADLKAIGGMERQLFTDLERVVRSSKG